MKTNMTAGFRHGKHNTAQPNSRDTYAHDFEGYRDVYDEIWHYANIVEYSLHVCS